MKLYYLYHAINLLVSVIEAWPCITKFCPVIKTLCLAIKLINNAYKNICHAIIIPTKTVNNREKKDKLPETRVDE